MPGALSGSPGVLGEPRWCLGHESIGAHSQPALLATEPETYNIPTPRFLFKFGSTEGIDIGDLPKIRSGCRPMQSKVPHPYRLVGGRDRLRDSHGPNDDSHAAISIIILDSYPRVPVPVDLGPHDASHDGEDA